ncbi:MAG: GTP pyrophosphokinase [Thermodesulfobacteriota bacterium]
MASLDFEKEKHAFESYYDGNKELLTKAVRFYSNIIRSLLKKSDVVVVKKIEGRVKDREECLRKFKRKYRNDLEEQEQAYEIKDYITDLLGIRVICLYEDQIDRVSEALKEHFEVIDVTDKISAMESTEDAFGYKGLHMDLAINGEMKSQSRYKPYASFTVEVQIRTLIQDAWSVLDHQIKYKKSIPNDLKRRINALSALFELADREFKEIRNATQALLRQATEASSSEPAEEVEAIPPRSPLGSVEKTLNAFSFLRVAGHYFRDFEFEDPKVDDFVQDILKLDSRFHKSHLHQCLAEHLKTVQKYRDYFLTKNPNRTFSPYTSIRHCLYLYEPKIFDQILYQRSKERLKNWLRSG